MLKLQQKIDKMRREMDDLVVELCSKAKANEHYPNYHIQKACHNAALGVQKASSELFYAHTALQ